MWLGGELTFGFLLKLYDSQNILAHVSTQLPVVYAPVLHTLPVVYAHVLHTLPVVYAPVLHILPVVCNAVQMHTLVLRTFIHCTSGLCLEADLDCSKLNTAVYFVCVAELGKLSGVAAILRFPLPDVESGSEPDEDDEEENPTINDD